jgi:ubiquinone/menaquinone biosynthesis C-methylase UbiE
MNAREAKKKKLPRLYHDLAGWFHLMAAPEDYSEEADFYQSVIRKNSRIPVAGVLELGSGGGSNALHMKKSFQLTLIDLSEDMLAVSLRINPECEHIQGDMRDLRLGRRFDSVFVQDAVSHITNPSDLSLVMKTTFVHCKPGGAALFAPDYVRETFKPLTQHGGHDGNGRSLRYLEWTCDPNPDDTNYIVDFAYLIKDGNDIRCVHDRFILGVFSKEEWKNSLADAGFVDIKAIPYPGEIDWPTPVFVGIKPEST